MASSHQDNNKEKETEANDNKQESHAHFSRQVQRRLVGTKKFLDLSITTRENQDEARLIGWSISLRQNRSGRKRVSDSREIYLGEDSLLA